MSGRRRARPAAGTIAALVDAFRESPRYLAWAASTRALADRRLTDFARRNADVMADEVTRGHIVRARNRIAARSGPEAANAWMKTMRGLFAHAVDLEWIEHSPCRDIERMPSDNPDGIPAWRDDQIETFFAFHGPGSPGHTAATLMLYTGAAACDAVRLGWGNVRGERISYRRQKTRRRAGPLVDVPILPPLAELLATLPRDRLTFLETRYGVPRTAKGLVTAMGDWTRTAGLDGLSCHGLRKALGRRLAEAGCSAHEIMAVLGHESMAMAAHYSRAYDRARAADAAAERLGAAPESAVVNIAIHKRKV